MFSPEGNKINNEENVKTGWDDLAEMGDGGRLSPDAWDNMVQELEADDEGKEIPKVLPDAEEYAPDDWGVQDFCTYVHEFFDTFDEKEWNKKNLLQSIFKNAPLGHEESYLDKRKRKIDEVYSAVNAGDGYKYIQRLEQMVEENPSLKEEAEVLLDQIKKRDAHQGMTPKEYKESEAARRDLDEFDRMRNGTSSSEDGNSEEEAS